ncbi:MAG: HlyD family efflux transporter periplasmic adaptor subunit [Pseudomonadota bacterium]
MNRSRLITFSIMIGLAAAFFLYAFWPRATLVDFAEITQGPMMMTIDEEARARVRDVYVVSTPVGGRLMRVDVEPGDAVIGGETEVARMRPTNPAVLDVRTEEQAEASVAAARAALELAEAEAARADADVALARATRQRYVKLVEDEAASQAALDRADRDYRAAVAAARSAQAAIGMREADLKRAEAMLMDFAEVAGEGDMGEAPLDASPILAPISGMVLQVMHESETTLPAGAAILHLGDPDADLEIVAEVLSPEAVRVKAGDRVIVERWGGDEAMPGVVERVEPWAFTKVSALGIEEQRANVIIRLDCANAMHSGLGHDYRVYVRIVTWESADAVQAPSNSLFRNGDGWAVFVVENGRARLTPVEIGQNNGYQAEILEGVSVGDTVVLYPSDNLKDGAAVRARG